MQNFKLFALTVLFCASMVACSADRLTMGYFVDPISVSEDHPVLSRAKVLRDGKMLDAVEGHEVFAGDVVVTDATGQMQIAFLDNSSVRLLESTEFRLGSPGENKQQAEATLAYGHASFASSPTEHINHTALSFPDGGNGIANLINLGIGSHGAVATSCLSKIDVIVTRDPNGTSFTSNIAVIKGSATLTPQGASKVDLSYLSNALMTINTPVAGVTTTTTLNQGNLTKDQIAALAANSVSDTVLCFNRNNSVTINTVIKTADGVNVGKITEINGAAASDSFTTKDSNNKIIATWNETMASISLKRTFDGFTLSSTFRKTTDTGPATLRGPDGVLYRGTLTYDPKNGMINFTSLPARDGTSTIYNFTPNGPNGATNTIITVTPGKMASLTSVAYNASSGVQTTTTEKGTIGTDGKFNGDPTTIVNMSKNIGTSPPPANLPSGSSVDQNLPPHSP